MRVETDGEKSTARLRESFAPREECPVLDRRQANPPQTPMRVRLILDAGVTCTYAPR